LRLQKIKSTTNFFHLFYRMGGGWIGYIDGGHVKKQNMIYKMMRIGMGGRRISKRRRATFGFIQQQIALFIWLPMPEIGHFRG